MPPHNEIVTKRPISSAPRDGREIFAWDGQWWRDQVRWLTPPAGPPGWYFMRFLLMQPSHWYPRNRAYDTLLEEVARGYRPASSGAKGTVVKAALADKRREVREAPG